MPFVGTELEFIVFDDTLPRGLGEEYEGLTPASDYNIDYALLASTRMEPLLRDIRNGMDGAGMYCEGVKGECNLGQQEIAFRYDDALATCDNHSIYKNGAKEIADQHGKSLTFMAKFNEREGNSCHIHLSLRGANGRAGPRGRRRVRLLEAHGALHRRPARDDARADAVLRAEHQLLQALRRGQLRADRRRLGTRQPHLRAARRRARASRCASRTAFPAATSTSTSPSRRSSPAACYGIENELELEPIFEGNAYASDAPRVPSTLRDAAELFAASTIAREAFGEEVVEHYLNNARIEQRAYDAAITDWERVRGFERF